MSSPQTLAEKVWERHVVHRAPGEPDLLYIDLHLVHEVTSPQAFDGLRLSGRAVRRPDLTVATEDHNVPTINQHLPISEPLSRMQVEKLTQNCQEFGVELYGLGHQYQGIVHVIGPELGITQPGMTMVFGDSHTSTHGAFGNIAFGIGTSQVEQVMATQCLILDKPKTMRINVEGSLSAGVTSKDIILYIISKLTAAGGTGYFVEYAGSVTVVHPPHVALITRSQVMTDKIAASILARLLAKGLLVGVWVPPGGGVRGVGARERLQGCAGPGRFEHLSLELDGAAEERIGFHRRPEDLDLGLDLGRGGRERHLAGVDVGGVDHLLAREPQGCLLYTSDAADERSSVDLGGRRIIKKKKAIQPQR